MSCTRTIKTFEHEEIKIDTCNKAEIELMEKTIISVIKQKVDKINILIKNCDVYSYNGNILVNDRYNICSDLITVAEAFGLNIKQIQCSLRGKNYLITDELLTVLKQLNNALEIGKDIANKDLTEEIKKIIDANKLETVIDKDILDMIINIKENGQYTFTRKREVTTTERDGRVLSTQKGDWSIDANSIKDRLLSLAKKTEKTINDTNQQLRDGTSKLIYARARQMGYAVQEIKKGKQTQLVLVRYE